jgi:hypothetical protein
VWRAEIRVVNEPSAFVAQTGSYRDLEARQAIVSRGASEIVPGGVSGGPNTSHTIMISALAVLLDAVPMAASRTEYERAALEGNVLGKQSEEALRWRRDGEVYSPTGLVAVILAEIGAEMRKIPGPDYWLLPTGRSMYEESKLIESQPQ